MSWYDGMDQYSMGLSHLQDLPRDVLKEMLKAEGAVIKRAQATTAASMLQGPYNKGAVASAVYVGTPKIRYSTATCYVAYQGYQHDNRIAEIAFINEYGKDGQPARPFIRTANELYGDEAVEAAAEVYDNFLTKMGF